jgi:hypothetical protein
VRLVWQMSPAQERWATNSEEASDEWLDETEGNGWLIADKHASWRMRIPKNSVAHASK